MSVLIWRYGKLKFTGEHNVIAVVVSHTVTPNEKNVNSVQWIIRQIPVIKFSINME